MKNKAKFIGIIPLLTLSLTILLSANGCTEATNYPKEMLVSDTASFKVILTKGIMDIVLVQDSVDFFKAEISSQGRKALRYRFDADTLTIELDKRFKPLSKLEVPLVYLHFRDIFKMVNYGPGRVQTADTLRLGWFLFLSIGEIGEVDMRIVCDYLEMHNSANTLGHYFFSGHANTVRFYNRYGASVFAENLTSLEANIFNESVGDVRLGPTITLNAYLWGRGNIGYRGAPQINVIERKSSGQIYSLP